MVIYLSQIFSSMLCFLPLRMIVKNARNVKKFLAHWIRISDILSWDTEFYLPMLSYPGRQVTASSEIASERESFF